MVSYFYIDAYGKATVDSKRLNYSFMCTIYKKVISGEYFTEQDKNKEMIDGVTKFYFQNKGNPILYVDNPENIQYESFYYNTDKYKYDSRYYFEVEILRNQTYLAEFYSSSYFGDTNDGIVCIVVYPDKKEDFIITIEKMGIGDTKDLYSNPSEIMPDKAMMTAKSEKMYLNSYLTEEIKIKQGNIFTYGAVLLFGKLSELFKEEIKDSNGNIKKNDKGDIQYDTKFNLINGIVKFKSSITAKLKICFLVNNNDLENIKGNQKFYKIKKTNIPEKTFNIIQEQTQTSALLSYDTRRAVVYAAIGTKFYLSSSGNGTTKKYNVNEYERLDTNERGYVDKELGKIHLGNYGIVYEIQLLGVLGRKMEIIPLLNFQGYFSILLYTNDDKKWISYLFTNNKKYQSYDSEAVLVEGMSKIISIPSDGYFKFLLPGGNIGDICFVIK